MRDFLSPRSLSELADHLASAEPSCLIAGGTDLLIAPGHLPATGAIVNLGHLAELTRLDLDEDALIIGAGVTVARLAADPLVRRLAPALADAADQFGSVQIRNRATIGGNIANGSPAADLAPALVAMTAEADLLGAGGTSRHSVEDLLSRPEPATRRNVLTAFRLPLGRDPARGAFVKLGRRQEPTISRITLAAADLGQGGYRLVAGAIGSSPRRLPAAEAALNLGDGDLGEALAREVAAAIPGRASAAYKSRAIRALAADLLDLLARFAGDRR